MINTCKVIKLASEQSQKKKLVTFGKMVTLKNIHAKRKRKSFVLL